MTKRKKKLIFEELLEKYYWVKDYVIQQSASFDIEEKEVQLEKEIEDYKKRYDEVTDYCYFAYLSEEDEYALYEKLKDKFEGENK